MVCSALTVAYGHRGPRQRWNRGSVECVSEFQFVASSASSERVGEASEKEDRFSAPAPSCIRDWFMQISRSSSSDGCATTIAEVEARRARARCTGCEGCDLINYKICECHGGCISSM